jgi:murein DD-endopeptidase MepM/ murein hydrolase activator NlpD
VHFDHLEGFAPGVAVGQRVEAGQVVGWCGNSGGWSCAHLHTELLPTPPQDGWWQWPYGWSREAVEAAYYQPLAWWQAASARVQGATPEETQMILSGAQTSAIQAVVWGKQWDPAAADFAIPASWRDEWHAGRWRGAPLAPEQPVPEDTVEGKSAGSWQPFQFGAAVWLPDTPVSWEG